jgi:hypothetical protein
MNIDLDLIFIISALFATNLMVQNHWPVKGGVNYSRFYDVKSEFKPEFTLGFEREWSLGKRSAFCCGIGYTERRSDLHNKIIGGEGLDNICLWNFNCRFGYLDIPLLYKYYLTPRPSNRLYVLSGMTCCIGFIDYSEKEKVKFLFHNDEKPGYYYDYHYIYETGPLQALDSSAINATVGMGMRFSRYSVEAKFDITILGDVTSVRGATLYHRFMSFSLLGAYNF